MSLERAIPRALCVLIASVSSHSSSQAAQAMPPRLYEMVTQTTMPHLEENLRYSTTREQRCLRQEELWTAFPVLHHPALMDCRLDQPGRQQDALSYALICEGGHGTTGHATWQLGRKQSIGTLYVKLGGKNMTFHQTITATLLGECSGNR